MKGWRRRKEPRNRLTNKDVDAQQLDDKNEKQGIHKRLWQRENWAALLYS